MLDDRFYEALQESIVDDAAFDIVLGLLTDAFRCRSAALVSAVTAVSCCSLECSRCLPLKNGRMSRSMMYMDLKSTIAVRIA